VVRWSLQRFVATVNVGRVYETAQKWVPEGDHELPAIFLIYDSNAGSFAAEGKPFFNLFSSGVLQAPAQKPEGSSVREAEETMAHELQHILAEPYMAPVVAPDATWQWRWVDQVKRGLVSEGLANHCSPPGGFLRGVYEDPAVIAALLRRLEELLMALSEGRLTESEMENWSRENYFEVAEAPPRLHLGKQLSGAELDESMRLHIMQRPDLEHALGWWMVSRISQEGVRPDAALSLFGDPWRIYGLYNESAPADGKELRIAPTVFRYLEKLRRDNR
jgi:hypothetical protein